MDFNKLFRTQWDRTSAVILSLVGLIFLLVGYIGVSGTPYLAGQAPYILSGGVGGVFFLGYGATLWISADLRDEWRKLDRIEDALRNGTLRWTEDDAELLAPSIILPPAPQQHAAPVPHFESNVAALDPMLDTTEISPVPRARVRSTAPRRAASNGRARSAGSARGA